MLKPFQGLYRGRRVFCVGSGPSLLQQDPGRLRGEIVASTNAAIRWLRSGGIEPSFSVCTDRLRLLELQGELAEPLFIFSTGVKTRRDAKRFIRTCREHPSWLPIQGTSWNASGREPTFDPIGGVEHCGKSVIFMAVQLAVWMGASSVVLLGVDMNYSGTVRHCTTGLQPRKVSDDLYERHSRPAFVAFREALAARGVEFLNATEGGRVDVLPRARFEELTERKDHER